MRQKLLFAMIAEMYFPRCSNSKNAVRCLSRWIKNCGPLMEELVPTGFLPYRHRYITRKQYRIITKHLGYPFDEE